MHLLFLLHLFNHQPLDKFFLNWIVVKLKIIFYLKIYMNYLTKFYLVTKLAFLKFSKIKF